jgi:ferredoxin
MKVQLDAEICDGFGTCAAHAPDVFELDDFGYAVVLNDGTVPAGSEDAARRAVRDCPVHAITALDTPDGE